MIRTMPASLFGDSLKEVAADANVALDFFDCAIEVADHSLPTVRLTGTAADIVHVVRHAATAPAPDPVPVHLRSTSCYVCSREPHPDIPGSHTFWSIGDAMAAAAAYDARSSVRYSSGATTPEAAYVEATRGR